MVSIVYSPIKEIIVMEYIKYPNAEELIRNMVLAPGQPAVLYWAEGVVFLPVPVNMNNEKIVDEMMKGRLYWFIVSFAPMKSYSPMLAAEKGPEAMVINVSRSKVLSEAARWLKDRLAEG
ncbi:MAG: hypothetical protein QXK39_02160 [Nitrososphaerota archaeon]